jgi:hypothetical protein
LPVLQATSKKKIKNKNRHYRYACKMMHFPSSSIGIVDNDGTSALLQGLLYSFKIEIVSILELR